MTKIHMSHLGAFFPSRSFNPQLVESMDSEPVNTEGQLLSWFFFFLMGLGFELALFPVWPGPWSSHLRFLRSLGCQAHTRHTALGWDGGILNFLPGLGLNWDPPSLSLTSSQDYRCETQCLASQFLNEQKGFWFFFFFNPSALLSSGDWEVQDLGARYIWLGVGLPHGWHFSLCHHLQGHYGCATLITSSKPNHLLQAPLSNAITLGAPASTWHPMWECKHSVHNTQ
jgi:hypothetical protein